jgi:hypothetical protein
LHQVLDVFRPGREFAQIAVQRRAMAEYLIQEPFVSFVGHPRSSVDPSVCFAKATGFPRATHWESGSRNKMRRCASLTAQSQLLHCHAHDTVRTAARRKLVVGEL